MTEQKSQTKTLRGPNEWSKPRPLVTIYNGALGSLGALADQYLLGEITYKELKQQVNPATNWLRGSEKFKEKLRDLAVLLVLGWCPLYDQERDIENPGCITEELIKRLGVITGEKILHLNFYFVSSTFCLFFYFATFNFHFTLLFIQ